MKAPVDDISDKGIVLCGRRGRTRHHGSVLLTVPKPPVAEESKGETEIRSPCECEALVQFQTNTVAILQSLTEKNILYVIPGLARVQGSLGKGREGWVNGNGENFRLLQG